MTTEQALVPVRRTARQREERRIRIMGMVRSGFSYEEIARDECLSRERIRQIVTQSLKTDDRADRVDQARVQMARLEPALRLAARGVDNGKLSAINPLLRGSGQAGQIRSGGRTGSPVLGGRPRTVDDVCQQGRRAGLGTGSGRLGAHRGQAEAPGTAHSGQAEASVAPKNLETDSLGLGAL